MIAECDCIIELERLLNSNKIVFEQGVYKYKEPKEEINFEIFISPKDKIKSIKVECAKKYFMENYVKKNCSFETYRNYNSIFNFNILPYLKDKFLNDIGIDEVILVYNMCKLRGLKPRRIKNTMALLNQLIKYFQNNGIIDKICVFQVKRITSRNEFDINRIIFED